METQYTPHTPKVDYAYIIAFFVITMGFQACKEVTKMDLTMDLLVKVGIILLAFGIVNAFYEKYKSFGLMTREKRNNVPVINSCIPGTLGVVLISDGFLMSIGITVAALVVIGVGRYLLDKKRCDKFNQHIGKKGVAETEVTYINGGKMKVSQNESIDVTVVDGMIKKGAKIEVTGLIGFKPVVERINK